MLKLSEDAVLLEAPPDPAEADRPARSRWRRLIPALILVAGALTTTVLAIEFAERDADRVAAQRSAALDLLADDIERQLGTYAGVLRATRGLFDASDDVTRDEYSVFVETSGVFTLLPGTRAIGWSQVVQQSQLDDYVAGVKQDESLPAEVRDAYQVWPAGGDRPTRVIAHYVAPAEAAAALGLDLTSDAVLEATIEETRRTGEIRTTAPVNLAVDGTTDLGVIIILAAYDDRSPEPDDFMGVIGAILGLRELLDEVDEAGGVAFVISDLGPSDAPDPATSAIVYQSSSEVTPSEHRTIVDFGGRAWEVALANGELAGASRWGLVLGTITGGLATIAAAFGVWVLQRSGERSEARARELTRDLRDANRELEETSQRLLQAVSSAGVGLWERNVRTGEGWGYEEFEAMLGDEPGSWDGYETFVERLHPDDRAHVTAAPEDTAGFVEQTFRLRHRDGDYRWILSRSEVIERGGEQFVIGAHLDITDRPERVDRVEHLNRELVRSNQSLRDFTHVASHDLRSPLRAIASLVSFIREDAEHLDETTEHHLARIEQRTQRMNTLIDGLLTYARAGGSPEERIDTDVDALLSEIIETVDTPDETDIDLISDVGRAEVSAAAFALCVRNLVDNAIKHNPAASAHVEVRATVEDDRIVCSVVDNGPGIDPEYHEQVFEPFRRLHTDEATPGSGIGLAVLRRTLDAHGATLELDSEVDVGSTFCIRWPLT